MNSIKLSIMMALAAALISPPATAYAECGDPGQDPCTGPVPTVEQVVGIMQQLTNPNIPAVNKGNIVTPGFSSDEAGTIDKHLHRMDGHALPLNFVVTDIQPAPNNTAGATMQTTGAAFYQNSAVGTIALVDQGGHWLLTHHSAKSWLDAIWRNADSSVVAVPFG